MKTGRVCTFGCANSELWCCAFDTFSGHVIVLTWPRNQLVLLDLVKVFESVRHRLLGTSLADLTLPIQVAPRAWVKVLLRRGHPLLCTKTKAWSSLFEVYCLTIRPRSRLHSLFSRSAQSWSLPSTNLILRTVLMPAIDTSLDIVVAWTRDIPLQIWIHSISLGMQMYSWSLRYARSNRVTPNAWHILGMLVLAQTFLSPKLPPCRSELNLRVVRVVLAWTRLEPSRFLQSQVLPLRRAYLPRRLHLARQFVVR